jgi:hypothetical protein
MSRLTRMLAVVLSLGLLTLMLTVYGASSAQGATWMVNSTNLNSGTKSLVWSLAGAGVLHSQVLGNEVEYSCTSAELINLSLEKEGKLSSGWKVKFSGCTMKLNKEVLKACEPNHGGAEPGVILTNEFRASAVGGEGVVVVQPLVEEVVGGKKQPVFFNLKQPPECAVGNSVSVLGLLALVDAQGMGSPEAVGVLHEQATHNVKEGPGGELRLFILSTTQKATVSGEGKVKLISGENWSALVP